MKIYLYLMPCYRKYILLLLASLFCIALKAQTVYKTPSGTKYHLASCRMVKNVSREITIAQAKESGLAPCKICHPQEAYGSGISVHKARGEDKTMQCKGFTKAGTRCKHMTSIGNGYCYQHQP